MRDNRSTRFVPLPRYVFLLFIYPEENGPKCSDALTPAMFLIHQPSVACDAKPTLKRKRRDFMTSKGTYKNVYRIFPSQTKKF